MDEHEQQSGTHDPGQNDAARGFEKAMAKSSAAEETSNGERTFSRRELLSELQVSGPDSFLESTGVIDSEHEPSGKPALPYLVVAFGSSAGGLQAITDILGLLPLNTGMSFVLVPHLAPDQVSHLREISERYTRLPVQAIRDGEQPQPDNLYVLQPNEIASMRGGRFVVEPRRPEDRIPHTIDRFFRSLGEDMQGNAIGVVLSGADSDGASGLKAIRGEGGLAIVQLPATAQHSAMPRNSISADHVDMVLSPREIGVELARLASQFARPDVRSLELGTDQITEQESFGQILQMLRAHSGLELRQYKPDTLRRRIARRMVLLRIESLADYARFLKVRKDELTNLKEDVLIGVTRFFRDPDFWSALSSEILPAFFAERPPQRPIRVWCAGCSTGEEAYSLAITFLEYMTAHGLDNSLQVFATDASDRSIDMARNGAYPDSLAGEIAPERLRRFFVKVDHGYQMSKRVRDACIFARQNLCNDPPFSRIDFLSCRNVMIYFNQGLQRQIMHTFHYALEPVGYLLLGMSETLRDYDDAFSPADRKHKIYSKVGTVVSGGYFLPAHRVAPVDGTPAPQGSPADHIWSELELQHAGDRLVLARFGPPGLIIDEHLTVLQVRGQTAPFVELASGTVSWNLLRVVRQQIVGTVREAVEHTIAENVPVSRLALLTDDDGSELPMQVDVLPISQKSSQHRCFLVLFNRIDGTGALHSVEEQLSPHLSADEKERLIAQLRQDLSSTRFHLQSLIEERDVRNQELVSANEEIQSANEELQSTNEELETTKEELQSANEELQTVNDELQQRNAVLTQTGNDLNNLLTSVNIPLLMLTDTLKVRQFTPPMERLLNVRAADLGRSISEIRLQLSIENIEPVLREVLDTLGTRELEVQDRDGRWHLLRIRPYRTADNKIEGLVMVMMDIDQLRNTQQGLREARDFADSLVANVPVPVVVLYRDCTIRTVSRAFLDLTDLQSRDLTGLSLPDLVKGRWGMDGFREKLGKLVTSESGEVLEFEHESDTDDRRNLLVRGQVLPTDGDRVILLTMQDITRQRQTEHTLAEQRHGFEHEIERVESKLLAAQNDLRNLAAQLLRVQEEERQRIARVLHDEIATRLTALGERLGEGGGADLQPEAEALNFELQRIAQQLYPAALDTQGLPATLESLVLDFGARKAMIASWTGRNLPPAIPTEIATAFYRVAQEALRNVSEHAGRTHVKVLLEGREGVLQLEVRDFGAGFDPAARPSTAGLGMLSIKERARIVHGELSVHSQPGEGTRVVLVVPLPSEATPQ